MWGPYSKKYMGISRIMKESAVPGARFDFVIHPTYANSNVPAPNVTIPSEYHPWDCDSNGKYYRYRYELLWKDQLYADVDFFEIEEETWGIRVSFHNNTDKNQKVQSGYLQNAAYCRLKNAQIGYTLPKIWTRKAAMESVRVYVSGDNLVTFSGISGVFDPELLGSDWGDGKLYPLQRTISIGLNVNF